MANKKYAKLDQLTTAELESILRADLSDVESDPELIDHVLEVILEREQEESDSSSSDRARARADFEKLYKGLNEPLYPIPERTTGPGHELPFHIKSRCRKVRRTLLAAAVVAVLVALTCIPVLGDANLFQLVAHWTTEQFSFRVMEDGSSSVASADPDPVPEEFAVFQDLVGEKGLTPVMPVIPDGFVAAESQLFISPVSGLSEFSIQWKSDNNYIIFEIMEMDGQTESKYEKTAELVKTAVYGGVQHYFFRNNRSNSVAWNLDGLEYCMSTDLPISALEEIISSI
ncbi:DUF4367 domain-containing protein [Muriventricola aceti]|uniref:DUF4367 domain-containing protein n=1 Tax=Muriventricola aceti TaxID=2981773 RepID=UPI000821ACCC|nr:DUF4367 domain-containing protein [Muriventricola aceti]MCU6703949.1 DUF4367 domain-containing protein [Muriventricola aceti]SCJ64192.1 Uncharacterised protein [uncultured Flavonifractor sp.]